MKGHHGNAGLKGGLVDESMEAYILPLQTINRLSIHYRAERNLSSILRQPR
jgi:hypothetical protein